MATLLTIARSLLIMIAGQATATAADMAQLTVTPDKCVALRKGQVCYQKLRFSFSAASKGNYCLLAGSQSEPLHCWRNESEGGFVHRHSADSAVDFSLVNAQRVPVASTTVTVAWVYKKSRKRNRWRLF